MSSRFEIEYVVAACTQTQRSSNPKTTNPREVAAGKGYGDQEGGVYLTWEDLWVTVSINGKIGSRSILQGLTGYANPGETLAIMGPSGCGKSTLLDTLAGDYFLSLFLLMFTWFPKSI